MGSKQVCIPGIAYPHISRLERQRWKQRKLLLRCEGEDFLKIKTSKVVSASRIVFAGKVVSEEI
jgi:hypothetical protein